MGNDQELERLEQIIESLLDRFNQLKQEKRELLGQIKAQEEKITTLENSISAMSEDKTYVKDRVASLIESIEGWEKSLEAEPNEGSAETANFEEKSVDSQGESQLFSVGE